MGVDAMLYATVSRDQSPRNRPQQQQQQRADPVTVFMQRPAATHSTDVIGGVATHEQGVCIVSHYLRDLAVSRILESS